MKSICTVAQQAERKGGEGLPCPFLKIEEKCSDFGKSTLFVCVYSLYFYLKMQFSEYFGEKTTEFTPMGQLFCIPYMKRLSKCLYSMKLYHI